MKYRVSFPLRITQETFLDFDTEEAAQRFASQWREEQERWVARMSTEMTAKITAIDEDPPMPFYPSTPNPPAFSRFTRFTSRRKQNPNH
jgi:hypothetical protein